jgi:hypothetical protein
MLTRPLRTTAALLAAFVVAACGEDSPTAPSPDANLVEAATDLRRILIGDAVASTADVFDLKSSTKIQSVALAGPASLVYASPSGRYGILQQRTQGLVNFVDGGIYTEGSGASTVARKGAPARLAYEIRDSLPTHESVAGNWISIFFDGSGKAIWIDERDFYAGNYRTAVEINSGGPQHSASATLVTSAGDFFTLAPKDPAGNILPQGVQSFNRSGQSLGRLDACPNMHGNAAIEGAVIFGCQDGILYVRLGSNGMPTKVKANLTGSLAGMGVRNAYSEYGAKFIVGQVLTPPGVTPSQRILATIDPLTGTIEPLPMPAGVVDHRIAVDAYNNRALVLGTNGSLYIFNGLTRQLQHTLGGLVPALPTSAIRFHEVATADGVAFVASPYTGEVIEVNTGTGAIVRRHAVGGAPSRLAILGVHKGGQVRLGS